MMRLWGEDVEVYLYREPIDMRRGRNPGGHLKFPHPWPGGE